MKNLGPVNETQDLPTWIHTYRIETFTIPGTLTVGSGVARLYFPRACTVVNVIASVGTAPTGASVIFDLNKNGSTMFSSGGNPTIAVSTNSDTSSVPAVTSIAAGDYLTVDIDQIGSTIAGADAVISVEVRVV